MKEKSKSLIEKVYKMPGERDFTHSKALFVGGRKQS